MCVNLKRPALLAMFLFVSVMSITSAKSAGNDEQALKHIDRTLSSLHDFASKADGNQYFELFAPDAVFLGTDATERWPIDEFKTYAMKRFETGKGWTYTLKPGTRHITVQGDIAWFDELLDNAKYGVCRGSGVLRTIDGQWKIAQYNLTFTVPNDAAVDVVNVIKEFVKQAE
jgi:ketosteroid isomerase-like protein